MTNTSEADFLHHTVDLPWMTIWASINGILLFLASLFNGWNLLSLLFFTRSGGCTTGHVLLGVLFINDFFSSAIFYPGVTTNIVYGNTGLWHERWFCQLMSFGGTLTALCSSFSISQIAIFRVFMTVKRRCPPYKIEAQKKRIAAILVISTYILGFIVPSLSYIPAGNREIDPPYGFCGSEPYRQTRVIQVVKLTSWVFIPTIITASCYWFVYGVAREMRQDKQPRSVVSLRRLMIRIRWMVVLKTIAHYPVALFYLVRHDESPHPTANLIVITVHFCSALFDAVSFSCVTFV